MTLEERIVKAMWNHETWVPLVGDIYDYPLIDLSVQDVAHVSRPYVSWVIPTSVRYLAEEVRRIQTYTKFKMLAIKLQRLDLGSGWDYAAVIIGVV